MAVYLFRVAPGALIFSPTVDEPYHIGSAVALYEAKAHVLGVQHPPLARLIAGLPLRFMGATLPQYQGSTMSRKEDPAYAAGTQVLYGDASPDHFRKLLAGARWAMLVFPLTALLYMYLLGRRLVGETAGVASALLLSLDPTFLGHGLWVCTDGAATAAVLASLFHGLRFASDFAPRRAAEAGLAFGLAIACKFSVLIPLFAVFLLILVLARPSVKRAVAPLLLFFLVAFIGLWATYFFRIGTLGDSDTLASAPQWSRIPGWIKSVPIPMPAFPIGLARLAGHSVEGQTSYLLGHYSNKGWWYYFPVVFLAKTPLTLLFSLSASLTLALRGKANRILLLATLLPAAFLLFFAMKGGIQIGIRHILPAIALLYLLAGCLLSTLRARGYLLVGIALLTLIETLPQQPDYLSYFNLAVGGRRSGARVAVDSNLDWGQDLYRLAHYLKSKRVEGRPYTLYLLGTRQAPLIEQLGLDPSRVVTSVELLPETRGLVCLSITQQALVLQWDWVARVSPYDRIGDGILVFDLDEPAARNAIFGSRP